MQISKISFIDGDKGILEYRGYPIEQLAESSSFLEVAFLLVFGSLILAFNIDPGEGGPFNPFPPADVSSRIATAIKDVLEYH